MPTGLWVLWDHTPDDAWVLPPVPRGPAPLLNHHHGLPVGKEAAEEKDERGCEQQAQAVEGVVARQAGAVEVEGRVQLDSDHGQQQADAVHHRLRAGLEVLEEHAELIHGSRLVGGAVRPQRPSWPVLGVSPIPGGSSLSRTSGSPRRL